MLNSRNIVGADARIRPYRKVGNSITTHPPGTNRRGKNYFLIGHKLSALIMAQRAAESFSVIFI